VFSNGHLHSDWQPRGFNLRSIVWRSRARTSGLLPFECVGFVSQARQSLRQVRAHSGSLVSGPASPLLGFEFTVRYRIKSLAGLLNNQSGACNFVWNFCNDSDATPI
jgi:hypothetical protein